MIWTVTVLSLLLFLDEVIIRLVTAWGAVQKKYSCYLITNAEIKLPNLTIFICLIHSDGQRSTAYTCECTDSYTVVGIRSQVRDNKS